MSGWISVASLCVGRKNGQMNDFPAATADHFAEIQDAAYRQRRSQAGCAGKTRDIRKTCVLGKVRAVGKIRVAGKTSVARSSATAAGITTTAGGKTRDGEEIRSGHIA